MKQNQNNIIIKNKSEALQNLSLSSQSCSFEKEMQKLENFLSLIILYSKQRIYTCINYTHVSEKNKINK